MKEIHDFLHAWRFNFEAAEQEGFEFGNPVKIAVRGLISRSESGIGRIVEGTHWWIVTDIDGADHVIRNVGGNLTFPF